METEEVLGIVIWRKSPMNGVLSDGIWFTLPEIIESLAKAGYQVIPYTDQEDH